MICRYCLKLSGQVDSDFPSLRDDAVEEECRRLRKPYASPGKPDGSKGAELQQ